MDQGGYESDPPSFQYNNQDTAGLAYEMDHGYYTIPAIEYGDSDEMVIRPRKPKSRKSNGPTASTEEKKFKCPKCDKYYLRKQHMTRHLRIECGKQRTKICAYCDYAFYYQSDLDKHLAKLHRF